MNPTRVLANKVIAKTNGCMHEYGSSAFYGFFYQGGGFPMYVNGVQYSSSPQSIPETSPLFTDPKFYPSFCVKTDGTATIRWFSSRSDLNTALVYCDYVIGACHPLVFNSKCVFNEKVNDTGPNPRCIYDPNNLSASRYNTGINQADARRTLLGHKANKTFVMVCTDGTMSMKAAANLMQDLGCDYAVNMDGGTPPQMRIANGYGGNGKVTAAAGSIVNTAVCAYLK